MGISKIEWTDMTWSPITGCTKISAGCKNCYAERMARRLAGRHGYPEAPHHFDVTLHPDRLDVPLRRKKPTTYFVCSMSDLFHEGIEILDSMYIWDIFAVMSLCRQHTFQLLTKRPHIAQALLTDNFADNVEWAVDRLCADKQWCSPEFEWPLRNVQLGVTIENQATADERREYLRQCPAAVKFVSYEPALGPMDWTGWEFVDQIVSGGESGPGARPSHPGWHRDTRDFCQKHGIAYFFKQHGAWTADAIQVIECKPGDRRFAKVRGSSGKEIWMVRVGKKRAGRLLDGKKYNEMPKRGS